MAKSSTTHRQILLAEVRDVPYHSRVDWATRVPQYRLHLHNITSKRVVGELTSDVQIFALPRLAYFRFRLDASRTEVCSEYRDGLIL